MTPADITPLALRSLVSPLDLPLDLRQMLADAIEIADSCASADIECHCGIEFLKVGDGSSTRWCDLSRCDPEDEARIGQALRYLRARGRINQHPTRPELVNFSGVPE